VHTLELVMHLDDKSEIEHEGGDDDDQ
jgi:hypothetical protein